ncbi:MAG: phytochelatin synthase family protein [Caldimonas sp.]
MAPWTRVVLALMLVAAAGCQSPRSVFIAPVAATAAASQATSALTSFSSDEGLARLATARAKADFALLANQFEAQSNSAFCGPTTAAIVLNAIRSRSTALPRDRSRLRVDDLQRLPPGADLSVPRYTQDNVIEKGAKTRAQVLGEPVTVDGRPVVIDGWPKRDFGYQLRQFDEMLRGHGLVTRMTVVDAGLSDDAIRADIAGALQREGTYVIVNYRREAVGQRGGGHISPLGAYDARSDSFLVLDVNPAVAGWVWMPTPLLVAGMRTFDTVENRGYVVVEPR